ncbi:MAG: ABC transporter ATP-binding protein/permease [Lachnospiraceae bacterium]|nr:ABC transporter ATP-binding protein/permease [Lachnospiraceae bacterium]
MIRISHLNKYFNRGSKNELHVVNDVNLEFGNTGLVCILGESGSGKTTLLNVLGGLDTFAGGEIQIEDTILKKYQPSRIEPLRNEKFGYIFQNYFLLQDYSVEYNVKLALNLYDLTEEEKDARVDYVLKQLRINRYRKKLVSKLSGGQQQRVSIARALVKSPQIILADEPTGNLDEENTLRTMSILKNISKECLVILVSHERRIVEFFADRIIEIRDGCIIQDRDNIIRENYQRGDDANIYLRELDKVTLENEQGHFDLYQNADSEEPQIRLNLAWKNGKLYVQNLMEQDVVLAGEETGCQMLDEERPKLDLTDVENFSYDLEELPAKKTGQLSFREIWKMALENIRLMGRKQIFVVVVMLAAAVLLTITLADFSNSILLDRTQIVSADSHYASLQFRRQSYYEQEEVMDSVGNLYDTYLADSSFVDGIFVEPDDSLSIPLKGYVQMRSFSGGLDQFSYVSADHLQKEDLLFGEMPEKYDEIVVDRLVLERFMKSKGNLANLYHSIEEFLGQTVSVNVYDLSMRIVGICDTQEMSVYCGQNILYAFSMTAEKIASVGELQKQYPGEYDDLVLNDDQILTADSKSLSNVWEDDKRLQAEKYLLYDNEFDIAGIIPDDYPFDFVLSENSCSNLQRRYVISSNKCSIYLEDPEKELPELQKLVDQINQDEDVYAVEVRLSMPYQKQLQEYEKARRAGVDSKKIFAGVIFLLSLIMLYFTVKSNAISRSEELTVYRLLGIGKRSILCAYMLEMLLINTYTSLPAILLTSVVLKLVSSIPSLEMQLLFPWWMILILIVTFYLVNVIVSILPVNGILSKPPAKLALKG